MLQKCERLEEICRDLQQVHADIKATEKLVTKAENKLPRSVAGQANTKDVKTVRNSVAMLIVACYPCP